MFEIYEFIAFAARKLFIIASEKIVNTYNVALENKTKLRNIPYVCGKLVLVSVVIKLL